MTNLADPATTTTHRGKRRRRAGVRASSTTSRATRIVRGAMTFIWLVWVPVLVGFYVYKYTGEAMGANPFGASTTFVVALASFLVAYAVATVLDHLRAIFMFAVLPALGAWIGYVGFGQPAWVGAGVGLALGGAAFAVRHQQGR